MTDSHSIACDECRQSLVEFALDELSIEESSTIAQHLAGGCEPCNRRLADILVGLAALPTGLARQLPPLKLERDLMQRIARPPAIGQSVATISPPATRSNARNKSLTSGIVGAAIALAACLVGVAAWTIWRGGISDLAPAGEREHWANLQRRLDEAERSQRFSSLPRLEFAYLNSQAPATPVHGHIVTDHITKQWHFYAFNLPPLPEGRAYQLWFVIGDSQYVAAGMLDADPSGTASRLVDVPSDLNLITGIAISDEPPSGSDQPAGERLYHADFPQ